MHDSAQSTHHHPSQVMLPPTLVIHLLKDAAASPIGQKDWIKGNVMYTIRTVKKLNMSPNIKIKRWMSAYNTQNDHQQGDGKGNSQLQRWLWPKPLCSLLLARELWGGPKNVPWAGACAYNI